MVCAWKSLLPFLSLPILFFLPWMEILTHVIKLHKGSCGPSRLFLYFVFSIDTPIWNCSHTKLILTPFQGFSTHKDVISAVTFHLRQVRKLRLPHPPAWGPLALSSTSVSSSESPSPSPPAPGFTNHRNPHGAFGVWYKPASPLLVWFFWSFYYFFFFTFLQIFTNLEFWNFAIRIIKFRV